ncbi:MULTISPECIES: bifunctional folylpolyglutamate synthase/dihydrofolate synthase [Nosocomiicoccus]|uniref:bifunctional folylpolyglutamate synthase/dihydrofolate synthase n=1 Tax=Nosocomiicoccus TaxID=489909 RepID=UPI0008A4419C|nr:MULTISPECIES: folylpolyglutamate synthase/dihydrofolate synthase family protein [Nosocomiicoccus]MDK6863112.1 folylpolyglutamate synthase/dihydrofolate synthase family protein [Nosocomiicoccus ampullae]OFL46197.1 bifunctional folylpolyglutamate synthase/dihydrofolate synthase [Nosocomiicoccus sp. HMSC067E10]
MNYDETLEWIHNRGKFGIKPGVKRMVWMLNELDNPQDNITGVHVVGTNGKGSVVSYIRSALNENEYSVGTFTSPYIEVFNERISIDGTPISNEDLAHVANIVRPVSERMAEETELGQATEFEIITAMMFVYFGNVHPVDIVVVEAGIGATHDSTNVFKPVMTILTSIGKDHTDILGETLVEITKDKAGVIKEDTPLVYFVDDTESKQVIYKVLEENHAKGIELGRDIILLDNEQEFSFKYNDYDFNDIQLKMLGYHQMQNASLALAALLEMHDLDIVNLDMNKTVHGVENVTWVGRIEVLQEDPTIIIDGAHNKEAVDVLIKTIKDNYADRKITVLFSCVDGKPIQYMVDELASIADEFVVTEFDFYRKKPVQDIYDAVNHPNLKQVDDYIKFVDQFDGDVLLCTGSLYFISYIKQHFSNK